MTKPCIDCGRATSDPHTFGGQMFCAECRSAYFGPRTRLHDQHPTMQEIATTLQVVSATARPHSHVSHSTIRLVGGSAEVCSCGMVALTPRDGGTGEWVTVAEACRRMTTGHWHDVRAHVP